MRCPGGHNFDVARQGYLNLLGRPAPRSAGTPAMTAARDRFLSAGHYRPVATRLAALPRELGPRLRLLDCGAGVGYYSAMVLEQLPGGRGVAVDVSVAGSQSWLPELIPGWLLWWLTRGDGS